MQHKVNIGFTSNKDDLSVDEKQRLSNSVRGLDANITRIVAWMEKNDIREFNLVAVPMANDVVPSGIVIQ